ncbi:MAG: ribonuclease H-like domain-containing protein [Bacteroidales bacterium]|jgi:DNA polymerase elongation subunit (family B)|nr:ribonuclease H-like domain-containing protein [Bacteroidales bacterium]MCK9449803.1 ribonuclease H-like domain-containing protein [Bacteroidales bacterium]MDD3701415.1 ribonuclease H-like domain-containing protein [Bacteroidales bacterium]MDY0369510.1 ribonuclease H-like domain-containing protein [Bacteroidales bacterium]
MLYKLNLSKILFLDIETVSQYPTYQDMDEQGRLLWNKKAHYLRASDDETPESLYSRAAIYAEFGKIIVISVGFFNGHEFRIKSFYGDDEKILLTEFTQMVQRFYNLADDILCAHNGKEFDFPYLSRRMLINGVPLPYILQIAGKKPWEVKHIDTMELWKFGDYKSYTSLELLTYIFNIPTPKDDIDGSMVGKIYWQDHDLERIKNYCQKDVVAIAQLLRRYLNEPLILPEDIVFIP